MNRRLQFLETLWPAGWKYILRRFRNAFGLEIELDLGRPSAGWHYIVESLEHNQRDLDAIGRAFADKPDHAMVLCKTCWSPQPLTSVKELRISWNPSLSRKSPQLSIILMVLVTMSKALPSLEVCRLWENLIFTPADVWCIACLRCSQSDLQ